MNTYIDLAGVDPNGDSYNIDLGGPLTYNGVERPLTTAESPKDDADIKIKSNASDNDPGGIKGTARTLERGAGDLLIAAKDTSGTYQLESGGIAGGKTGAGVATNAGGPGGENYFDTEWSDPYDHHETLGSVVVNPSRADGILTTALHTRGYLNPDGSRAHGGEGEEGTRRFFLTGENAPGAYLRQNDPRTGGSYQVAATYKSNGLGQATLVASAAPIQIGNYVWYDVDKDGIQDADENPVPGATVNLYEQDSNGKIGTTPVMTTTTATDGTYYFSSTVPYNGYALKTNTPYVIAVDNSTDYAAEGPLYKWIPTGANIGEKSNTGTDLSDLNDSDGVVEFETQFTNYPFLKIRTGNAGQNNHTYDFGYQAARAPTVLPSIEESSPPPPGVPLTPLAVTGGDLAATGAIAGIAALLLALGLTLAVARRRRDTRARVSNR